MYKLTVAMGMMAAYYCVMPLFHGLLQKLLAFLACALLGLLLCQPKMRMVQITEKSTEETQGERSAGIDLLKTLAIVLVFAFHFLFTIQYYQTPLSGGGMFLKTYVRWAASICVPLFIMITGYLQKNKKPTWAYYSKFSVVIISYLLNAILLILYLFFIHELSKYSIRQTVNLERYWYLGLYLGLYLMIPLLNLAWQPLHRRGKQAVLLGLVVLSSLSTVFNGWMNAYWVGLFPILYYYCGAFVREYKVQVRRGVLVLLCCLLPLLPTLKTYFTLYGELFQWRLFGGYCNEYNAFPTVAATLCAFLLCYQIHIRSRMLRKWLGYAAVASLEIYLLTVTNFGSEIPALVLRLLPNTPIVFSFLIALCLSMAVNTFLGYWLHRLSSSLSRRLVNKVNRNISPPNGAVPMV
ncbi:MAG: acyltransferase family protein [Clostridia bacterium]